MSTTPEQATVTIPWPVPDDLKRRVTDAVWDATGRTVNRATACDAWKAAIGVLIEAAGEVREASGVAQDGAQ